MYLSELSKDRNNNLDIMRFFAAVCVIISHSIPLSKVITNLLGQILNS